MLNEVPLHYAAILLYFMFIKDVVQAPNQSNMEYLEDQY